MYELESRARRGVAWLGFGLVMGACATAPSSEGEGEASLGQAIALAPATVAAQRGWSAKVASSDPADRIAAVEAAMAVQAPGSAAKLEQLAQSDPDAVVRERAVLAYAQIQKKSGVTFLKQLALGTTDDNVRAAALASLAEIREATPDPDRGWLKVELPPTFAAGKAFQVLVHLGSSQAATAKVTLTLPKELVVTDASHGHWKGALAANASQDVTFTVVATASQIQSGALVNLTLDYPEQLDTEIHKFRTRIAAEGQNGHFEPAPAPKSREP